MDNVLDLTDPEVVKMMNIDPIRLSSKVDTPLQQRVIYNYTNEVSNQAYDAGYSGIIFPSSRKSGSNRAVVLFDGRYDANTINTVLDVPIK